MPKAELKTKTNPNGHHPVAVWVRFGFQLGSLEKKCSGLRGKPCTLPSAFVSVCQTPPPKHLRNSWTVPYENDEDEAFLWILVKIPGSFIFW